MVLNQLMVVQGYCLTLYTSALFCNTVVCTCLGPSIKVRKMSILALNYTFLGKIKTKGFLPSSIYSWSIGHILEHEFFCLGRLGCAGSKGKKVDLSFSEQLLRVVFSTFYGQKKNYCSVLYTVQNRLPLKF